MQFRAIISIFEAATRMSSFCPINRAIRALALATTLCTFVFPVFNQTQQKKTTGPKKSSQTPTSTKKVIAKTSVKPAAGTKKPSQASITPKKVISKTTSKKIVPAKPKAKPLPEAAKDDKAEFDKAAALGNNSEKITVLKKFVTDFPKSAHQNIAREMLALTAITEADGLIVAGNTGPAVDLYKLAVESAPKPVPEKLFTESLSKIPGNLYWRGSREEGLAAARTIETKADTNAGQLLTLAAFYVGIEDGEGAARISELAVRLDPSSSNAFQSLGLARRVNFQLDESVAAYAKAVELDPESVGAKRSLAEMKRAIGRSDDAVALYRELLAKDESSIPARTGLILSLFDSGKRVDAETEMSASLEKNPNNLILLASAAYWYAAHNDGEKAIDLAQKAIATEPRYIWSHIALARGYLAQKKPVDAEEALLRARQYGNFPTLGFEIASARMMAGFYREAVEELEKSFSMSDGMIVTRLGGRIQKKSEGFAGLLADERRASIFEPVAADDPEISARLKSLLDLQNKLKDPARTESVAAAADAFVSGDDAMKLHRQLYTASALLEKKIALDKVLELTKSAVGKTDEALDIPHAAAAVMASELYESRSAALARNEFIRVPAVPRPMLSAILRGRIEEVAGSALLEQNNPSEAVVRLRRAVSVMPTKSAWWRSSLWRLGTALQADGKEDEALESYIKSYAIDKPDLRKYTLIEVLFKKLKGTTDGLDARIGSNPMPVFASQAVAQNTPPTEPAPLPVALPAVTPTVGPPPTPSEIPAAIVEATPTPAAAKIAPTPTPSVASGATVDVTQAPVSVPTAEPSPTPDTITDTTASLPLTEKSPTAVPAPTVREKPIEKPAADTSPTPEASAPIVAVPTPSPEESPVNERPGKPAEPIARTTLVSTPLDPPVSEPAATLVITGMKTEPSKPSGDQTAAARPLFDPVIITIPKTEIKKQNSSEPPAEPGTEAKKSEEKPVSKTKSVFIEPAAEGRPRIVDGKEVHMAEVPPCEINVSQDNLSIINNGSLGVLVGVDGDGDLKDLKAGSSSPDLSVTLAPDIAGVSGRTLYVVKSLNSTTGTYKVLFEMACGNKEITVTVR